MPRPDRGLLRRCRPLLGTFVEIAAPEGSEAVVEQAFARIAHVHARMSFHAQDSDLAALREARPGTPVCVDSETVEVLAFAATLHRRSGGLFDVAVGARLVASGFLPRPAGLNLRGCNGSAADIEIRERRQVICHRRMLIDLGGIAKGYAVDRAIEVLAQAGVEQAIVNAGGDLRTIGSAQIHLRGADGSLEGAIALTDKALASSSNRHLRRRHRGVEHAVHRGAGGAPVLSENAVSVIAPDCMLADAMTKVALAAPALADEMLAEYGGCVVRLATRGARA